MKNKIRFKTQYNQGNQKWRLDIIYPMQRNEEKTIDRRIDLAPKEFHTQEEAYEYGKSHIPPHHKPEEIEYQ